MNWILPAVLIGTNLIFAFLGYFLGKKHRNRQDTQEWLRKFDDIRKLERETRNEIAEQVKKLERDKILFEQATWQEKLKILNGNKE